MRSTLYKHEPLKARAPTLGAGPRANPRIPGDCRVAEALGPRGELYGL
jgi:hypothetical protein